MRTKRKGLRKWLRTARWFLATAGVRWMPRSTEMDLVALFDRDYEPQEAAFSILEEAL
jgi:hypothetical protein